MKEKRGTCVFGACLLAFTVVVLLKLSPLTGSLSARRHIGPYRYKVVRLHVMPYVMKAILLRDVGASPKTKPLLAADTSLAIGAWLPAGARLDESYWSFFPRPQHQHVEDDFHGQDEEDRYARDTFFNATVGGTYLEMGALNGVTFSNTLYFERHQGWKGLLIEPNRAEFQQLRDNRDSSICVNAAICSSQKDLHLIESDAVGGIYEFMAEEFRQTWHPNVSVDDLPVVPCVPLAALLSKLQVRHIDFFSLDVEHGELEVLRTFDFHSVHVNVLVVEADGVNEEKDYAVRELMLSNNFLYHGHVVRNDWFVHNSYLKH